MFNWLKRKSEKTELHFIEIPFQKINVKHDDLIILLVPDHLDKKAQENIKQSIKDKWPDLKNKVMVLEEGIRINVIKRNRDQDEYRKGHS